MAWKGGRSLENIDYRLVGQSCIARVGPAKVIEGQVRMERNFALDKKEVAAGFVLTCQAHPLTDRVVLSFDER